MRVTSLEIPEVKLFAPNRLGDERGYFAETFRSDLFKEACGDYSFVQDNESLSVKPGTIRGLHFQCEPHVQGKLVRCIAGSLFDVAVDIRNGSPTYGHWVGEILSAQSGRQLWVPPGFAHGFCSLEPNTIIAYKVTSYYSAECDKGLAWDDKVIDVAWPELADPDTLSDKDCRQPTISQLPQYFFIEGAV